MAATLARLTHKITMQLHLVAESSNIFSSRSRRPVRKLWMHPRTTWLVAYTQVDFAQHNIEVL